MSEVSELVDKIQELIEERERMRLACDRANSERRRQVRRHHEAKDKIVELEKRIKELEEDLADADEICPFDCSTCHDPDSCPCENCHPEDGQ